MSDDEKIKAELVPYREILKSVPVGLVLTNDDDLAWATSLCKLLKSQRDALEDKRVYVKAPMLEAGRRVDGLFNPTIKELDVAISGIKRSMGEYSARIQAERIAKMQQSAETYAAGGTPTEPIPAVPQADGLTVTAYWDFNIIDPDKVPRELCSPDWHKIKKAIAYADTPHTPPRPIAGVEFFSNQKVRVAK